MQRAAREREARTAAKLSEARQHRVVRGRRTDKSNSVDNMTKTVATLMREGDEAVAALEMQYSAAVDRYVVTMNKLTPALVVMTNKKHEKAVLTAAVKGKNKAWRQANGFRELVDVRTELKQLEGGYKELSTSEKEIGKQVVALRLSLHRRDADEPVAALQLFQDVRLQHEKTVSELEATLAESSSVLGPHSSGEENTGAALSQALPGVGEADDTEAALVPIVAVAACTTRKKRRRVASTVDSDDSDNDTGSLVSYGARRVPGVERRKFAEPTCLDCGKQYRSGAAWLLCPGCQRFVCCHHCSTGAEKSGNAEKHMLFCTNKDADFSDHDSASASDDEMW